MARIAVVTGANKGIGYAIVKGLCGQFDGIIYLTARDESLGTQALNNIKSEIPQDKKKCEEVRYHQLDITKDASVQGLKEYLSKEHGGVDILINNAAIAYKSDATESFAEQAANTININYTGSKKVCDALFPILKPHARVVNVSSTIGLFKIISDENMRQQSLSPNMTEEQIQKIVDDFIKYAKDGTHTKHGYPNSAYGMSKVALTALSFVQQRKFDKDGRQDVIVNACCPGYCATDLTSHKGHLTSEQGAETPLYLALLPQNVGEPRGKLVSKKMMIDVTTGEPM